ncbi:glycosyl transferase [Elizabethkingia miricola]|uniref:Glycosyl transferase n=1 Tax=Elizabethkingia miricola TaxID=172045 RepID=A0ABD4DKW6_ELIMR|nr:MULTISPECIES: glycosyltransferase family 2 protein [Elizabethkingia]KUY19416.1 glycosyl transferase [Elizabethkingia miricola]MCL1651030.1 glycosyltransferase family 2 protein [Elizabethkingia miricola]OPC71617.1 glycosyl transferase [Elizabethkingia miricola]OPC73363.1 glycosyl transferase [Elizabethkingia miricola]QCO46577.1 glycosyltransferase family 2 protein [Elizabethkingia sp. 2-6]
MEKVSGLIITYNEERNIAAVLSCFNFCDEIIVVDSFSTDKTVEIAQQNPKVKVYQQEFVDYTKQRNKALSLAENDWVFFLDGDERTTPDLEKEIIETINNKDSKDAYYIYRIFFVGQKKINFSGTQNDKNFRLFRKSKAFYTETKKVHETLEVQGSTGILKHKLLHYSFENFESFKKKMIYYGLLKGTELVEKGKKYSVFTRWSRVAFKFIKTYFLKLGILDGIDGLKISYLQSLYVDETYQTLKNKS